MLTTRALLFDLDGTLLDTAPEFTHCLNTLLVQEGKPPLSIAELRSWISFGAKGMVQYGFKLSKNDPYKELVVRFLALYEANIGSKTQFFPGMDGILQEILAKDLPFAIVTNKPLVFTNLLMQRFIPLASARCIVAGDSLPEHKPHPAPLLHACQQLAVDPSQCWYIGDAQSDVQASHRAKMRCAIAHYGYIPEGEDAISWQADYYLSQPGDITHLL